MKTCCSCRVDKEKSCFGKSKGRKDGLHPKCRECRRDYYKENIGACKSRSLKRHYSITGTELYRKKIREYAKKRRESDPLFKMKGLIRTRVYRALKAKRWNKKSSNLKLIGCSFEEAKKHLTSTFKEGMSWDNHGDWHIDHIIPLDSAKTLDELEKLCHYTNLQAL